MFTVLQKALTFHEVRFDEMVRANPLGSSSKNRRDLLPLPEAIISGVGHPVQLELVPASRDYTAVL